MSLPFCDFCGKPARLPQTRCVPVYATAFTCDPDTVWYGSPACEDRDDRAWAPELCTGCRREIRLRRDDLDARDPRALQLLVDADGNAVCRRCAGVSPNGPLPRAEALDTRSHQD